MAKFIPAKFPDRLKGEPESAPRAAAFEAFAALPDSWTVFFAPAWLAPLPGKEARDGEADFVLAHDDHGLFLFEVLHHADGAPWLQNTAGQETPGDSDLRRQLDALEVTRDALRAKLRSLPTWRGDVPLMTTGLLALEHPRSELHQLFPAGSDYILAREATDNLEAALTRLKRAAAHKRMATAKEHTEARRALHLILAGDTEIELPLGEAIFEDDREIERLTRIELLDDQSALLQRMRRERRLAIHGGAGSGKTVLAREMAQRLGNEGYRTLLVCFNRPLADFLRRTIRARGDVTVETFHSLSAKAAKKAGLELPDLGRMDEWNEEFHESVLPDQLLDALDQGFEPFDAILVDEGQDFRASWQNALYHAQRDKEEGIFFFFYDDNQRLNVEGDPPPRSLAQATLVHNLRNTQAIHSLARPLYSGGQLDAVGPEGRHPRFHPVKDEAEVQGALERVIARLCGKEDVAPGEIVVLTPRTPDKVGLPPELLEGEDVQIAGYPVSTEMEAPGVIRIHTIQRFKGLESPVVILVAPGDLPSRVRQEQMLYVAITRARNHLEIIATRPILDFLNKAVSRWRNG